MDSFDVFLWRNLRILSGFYHGFYHCFYRQGEGVPVDSAERTKSGKDATTQVLVQLWAARIGQSHGREPTVPTLEPSRWNTTTYICLVYCSLVVFFARFVRFHRLLNRYSIALTNQPRKISQLAELPMTRVTK